MDDDVVSVTGFFVGLLVGVIGTFLVVALTGGGWQANFYQKNVCTYLNGDWHKDVCVVDGKVVTIPASH